VEEAAGEERRQEAQGPGKEEVATATLEGKAISPYLLCMTTLTVTAKGQVTLRKELLDHLGVRPGEKIDVEKLPDGRVEVRAARRTGKISDAFNFLKREGQRPVSIEEMNETIANGWAGKLEGRR
jgi:AbrB family looped-hinge helix DNA binding protein